jgi:putative heme-binding domain-containing protein
VDQACSSASFRRRGSAPSRLRSLVVALSFVALSLRLSAEDPAKGPSSRITEKIDRSPPIAPFPERRFALVPGDVVVFIGPENSVIEQQYGEIELRLTVAHREARPKFRHMGWEGDTVYRQNRMENWGSWRENLDAVGATVVVTWFGQTEAFDTTKTSADFISAYGRLLDELSQRTARVVILSPTPFEEAPDPRLPDNRFRNTIVEKHASLSSELARERGAVFVDLFSALSLRPAGSAPLTRDGFHFTRDGLREIASVVSSGLAIDPKAVDASFDEVGTRGVRALGDAIIEKNRLWFDTWRCMNWAFAYGDRTTQPFASGTPTRPRFVEELQQYRPLVAHADASIHAIAARDTLPEPLPPAPHRPDPAALSPEQQMANFVVRDGFEVRLFADETNGVVRPVQIRWDDAGRLWVLCVPSYPQLQPGERGHDYLVVVEDLDGDGRADGSRRVAEGLNMPMGFELGDGGVYLCESTQLVHLRDTDGDGAMDNRRVVLSGFGTGDSHQTLNSIRWGPDGCLWFSQGYHIWSYVETPHGNVELHRSGLWRLDPRTLELHSFLNESTAGLNCWGVTFDDYGQVFHASGADVAVWHTTPALISTLHPLSLGPGLAHSRGKSMEPEFLGSSQLPDELRGALLKSVYFTSQVLLYRLHDQGSSFRSEELGELISSRGTEFRPLETRVGPDGAIWICDWLNPVIGHYQASYRDPRRDRSHGRIWRVFAKGRPLLEAPRLDRRSARELVEALTSSERQVREAARVALFRRARDEALAAADAALVSEDGRSETSARRLYGLSSVYAAHGEHRPEIIDRLLSSPDFRWRAWGTRLVGAGARRLESPLVLIARSAADEHPRVRLEAVVAASRVRSARAIEVATRVLEKPTDFAIEHALTQCIHALAPEWQDALARGELDFEGRTSALARILVTHGSENAVATVRRLLAGVDVVGAARDSLWAVLVETGTTEDIQHAIVAAGNVASVLAALVRRAPELGIEGREGILALLLRDTDTPRRVAACRVIAAWRDRTLLDPVTRLLSDPGTSREERSAAILTVGAVEKAAARDALIPFLDEKDLALRNAALEALAPIDPELIAVRVARFLRDARASVDFDPLLLPHTSLREGPRALAQALADDPPDEETARRVLAWLGEKGKDDRDLLDALGRIAGYEPVRPEYDASLVRTLVEAAKREGDVDRGAVVFRSARAACTTCHRVGAEGGVAGPDLTAIGRAMTAEVITESVYWPKRQVKEGYLLTSIVTSDGAVIQGYLERERGSSITLRDAATGETRSIAKSSIAEHESAGTLMPEGLLDGSSDRERLDLLAYLFGLGR